MTTAETIHPTLLATPKVPAKAGSYLAAPERSDGGRTREPIDFKAFQSISK